MECKMSLAWLEMEEDSSSLAHSLHSLDFHNFSLINSPLKFVHSEILVQIPPLLKAGGTYAFIEAGKKQKRQKGSNLA